MDDSVKNSWGLPESTVVTTILILQRLKLSSLSSALLKDIIVPVAFLELHWHFTPDGEQSFKQ